MTCQSTTSPSFEVTNERITAGPRRGIHQNHVPAKEPPLLRRSSSPSRHFSVASTPDLPGGTSRTLLRGIFDSVDHYWVSMGISTYLSARY
mmetsp:Transcript_57522/g.171547  ORF Transcript_57522/g.171547 Transcript_57522/m.171547 type:complete len:91 (-) Transcript_57522:90-362(-)